MKRPAEVIGPSVAAFGIGPGATGTRADLLVCDDVVDVRSLHSKAERDRVADYFANNLMNLLEPDGRFWGLFTPWHRDDLNARLKKNSAYAFFSRGGRGGLRAGLARALVERGTPRSPGPDRLLLVRSRLPSAARVR